MPCLKTICVASFTDVNLHFLSDDFKGLMLFTNLHFSSTSSCMTVTNRSMVVGAIFSSVLSWRCNLNLPCASWRLMIFVFSGDILYHPRHVEDVRKPNT